MSRPRTFSRSSTITSPSENRPTTQRPRLMLRWRQTASASLGFALPVKTLIRSKAIYRNLEEAAPEDKSMGSALSHRNSRPMASPAASLGARRCERVAAAKRTPALIHSVAMSARCEPSRSHRAGHGGDPRRHEQARGAVRPHDDAVRGRRTRRSRCCTPIAARCGCTTPRRTSWCSRSRPASRRCAFPPSAGIVGACARDAPDHQRARTATRTRASIPTSTSASGYRTRCMLALPLIDHKDVLVGVMQVLNKAGGVFDADDEIARDGARRAMRGRAAARAHDRSADRGREDAPGARDGARRADEHAARRHADASRLRPLRHVPAGEPHRRRHVRPRAASTRDC